MRAIGTVPHSPDMFIATTAHDRCSVDTFEDSVGDWYVVVETGHISIRFEGPSKPDAIARAMGWLDNVSRLVLRTAMEDRGVA